MKKLIITIALLLTATFTFAQVFQVKVRLQGNCVQPDQGTYYVVKVDVENTQTNTIVETETSTTLTTNYGTPVDIIVYLDQFCTADNTKKYKIHVEAAKVYLSPPSIICSEKETFNGPWSCDDFWNTQIPVGPITLN
jgi:hypothetical protein